MSTNNKGIEMEKEEEHRFSFSKKMKIILFFLAGVIWNNNLFKFLVTTSFNVSIGVWNGSSFTSYGDGSGEFSTHIQFQKFPLSLFYCPASLP